MLIPIDKIVIRPGRRRAIAKDVAELAKSIETIGLQFPISVMPADQDGNYRLIAGHNRLEASKKLGRTEIDARIIEDKLEGQLWEISENLHRSDLTVMQRTLALGRWVRLVGKKLKENERTAAESFAPVGGAKTAGRPESGVRLAARSLGVPETTARRAVKITTNLTKEAQKAAEVLGLDNSGRALEAASGVPPGYQVGLLKSYADRRDELAERAAIRKEREEAAKAGTTLPPPRTPEEALERWYWGLDAEEKSRARLAILKFDAEAFVAELDRTEQLFREDRAALH